MTNETSREMIAHLADLWRRNNCDNQLCELVIAADALITRLEAENAELRGANDSIMKAMNQVTNAQYSPVSEKAVIEAIGNIASGYNFEYIEFDPPEEIERAKKASGAEILNAIKPLLPGVRWVE